MNNLGRRLRSAAAVMVIMGAAAAGTTGMAQAIVVWDVSWSSQSVDATDGTATNTLTFTVPDYAPAGQIRIELVGQDGEPFRPWYGATYRAGSVEGPATAGEVSRADGRMTFRYRFPVPRYGHRADLTWRVTGIGDAGLPTRYDYDFTARSLVDSTPPGYTLLQTIMPEWFWYGGVAPTKNPYWLQGQDSESGVLTFGVTLTGPDGDTVTASSIPRDSMPYPPSALLDTELKLDAIFPVDKQVGTWTVTDLWITDLAGNTATYSGLSLAPLTFTDNTTITLTDVAATPAELNNWYEPQTSVLSMNVTAPTPISSAELVVNERCTVGTPTLPATSGVLSVPITFPKGVAECGLFLLLVRDQAGNASVLGRSYGAPELPELTRRTGPAPEIRGITASVESVDWGETTEFDVTVDLSSWVGVTGATLDVLEDDLDLRPRYKSVPDVRDGSVTFPIRTRVSDLTTDELTVVVTLHDKAGLTSSQRGDQKITVLRPAGIGGFRPATPTRLLDTRASRPIGPGGTLTLDTNVPDDANAVVLNVTAVAPTRPSYLTVWADGATRPNTSNLNVVSGQTVSNLVTVPVSADGKVRLRNHDGNVHLVVDSFGHYDPSGWPFRAMPPTRVLDTRQTGGPLRHGTERLVELDLPTASWVPATVLNVTAIGTAANGYLTVWQDGTPRPATSNINFPAGWTGANQAIVPATAEGRDNRIHNHGGATDVVVDVAGFFDGDRDGSYFVPTGPRRVLDTRQTSALGQRAVRELAIPGLPAGADAVVLNVTATEPSASGYLTVWPAGSARPTASNLNFTRGATVPNMVTVPVRDGKVQLYNHVGTTHVLADLAGYYLRPAG